MRTSARNLFLGHVKAIKRGPVNAEVTIDLGGGDEIAAVVTSESVESLELSLGKDCHALIKASWVIVTNDDTLQTSARNRLCGTVTHCKVGPVNAEVVIGLKGGKSVAAIVTQESVERLGLHEGAPACALIKASHVILAVHS